MKTRFNRAAKVVSRNDMCMADVDTSVALSAAAPLLTVTGASGRSEGPGVLFVTDEVFLPHRNGSSQIYTQVAQTYARAGWRTHCLSFYRDLDNAQASRTLDAYRNMFDTAVLAPGWNLGGTWVGRIGMGIREAARWLTGNVFASHPFLAARQPAFGASLKALVRQRHITQIYFHKPHTMLLLEPVLHELQAVSFILDLHDDFVSRSEHYTAAYAAVFRSLPYNYILRQHRNMYLRHLLGHANTARSRRREMALLSQCNEVRTASDAEYRIYVKFPALSGRVRHVPWHIRADAAVSRDAGPRPYHAGFIGAESVMNLDAVIHLRERILPRVRVLMPTFRMLVAGTLARNARLLLHGIPNVVVWDELPDVARFYAAVSVAAVPLRFGTGVSVKAIEALTHGCPLVTTTVGVRGITATVQHHQLIDIVDDPGAFAAALVRRAMMDTPPDHQCRAQTRHDTRMGGLHPQPIQHCP